MRWRSDTKRSLARALAAALTGPAAGGACAADGLVPPERLGASERHGFAHEDEGVELSVSTEYVRAASEREVRVALEVSPLDALELGLALGVQEERLSLAPGERRPEGRQVELSLDWTFLELDAGIAIGLVLENAWTRADEGFRFDEEEGDGEEAEGAEDDEAGASDPGSSVERGVELHVGALAEIELGERVVAAAELFRERVDGDGSAVTLTGVEIGIGVRFAPRLTLDGSATRLRAAGEATGYSIGLSWAADERLLLGIGVERRDGEPDLVTFAIGWRLL